MTLEADDACASRLAFPSRQPAEDAARLLGRELVVQVDLHGGRAEAIEQRPRQPPKPLGRNDDGRAEAFLGAVLQGDHAV